MVSFTNKFILPAFLAATGLFYLLYYNHAEDVSSLHEMVLSLKGLTKGEHGLSDKQQSVQRIEDRVSLQDSKEVDSRTKKNEEYPHHDLFDRNLTLINLTNFKFIINNDICNVRRVALVTIIHTAVDNHEARSMIRSIYCKNRVLIDRVKLF